MPNVARPARLGCGQPARPRGTGRRGPATQRSSGIRARRGVRRAQPVDKTVDSHVGAQGEHPMSQADLAEVWARSLEELSDLQIEPHQRAWLRLTRPLGLVENTALIATPNEFVKEQLETRLRAPDHPRTVPGVRPQHPARGDRRPRDRRRRHPATARRSPAAAAGQASSARSTPAPGTPGPAATATTSRISPVPSARPHRTAASTTTCRARTAGTVPTPTPSATPPVPTRRSPGTAARPGHERDAAAGPSHRTT